MSSNNELVTQERLDEALRLLYRSRPAKAAQLLGLVEVAQHLEKSSAAYTPAPMGATVVNPAKPPITIGGISPTTPNSFNSLHDIKADPYSKGDDNMQVQDPLKVNTTTGPGVMTSGPTSIKASSFLAKTAMTEQEYLAYYGSGADVLGADSSLPMEPKTMLGLTAGGAAAIGANRMRTKNIAKKELANIRKQYLKMVEEGITDKNLLKNLNKELKLRGALGNLKAVPTLGMADALLAKSEGQLAKGLLKKRYKGVVPTIAAGLLGTLAYNKLND